MWTWLTGSCSNRTDLLPDVSVAAADTDGIHKSRRWLTGIERSAKFCRLPAPFARRLHVTCSTSSPGWPHAPAEQHPSRLAEGGELLRMTAGYVASQPFIADTRLISSSTLDRNSFSGGEVLAL
jgi:hypothetical protein